MISETEAHPIQADQPIGTAQDAIPSGADWILLQRLLLEPLQNEIKALRQRVEALEQGHKPARKKHRDEPIQTESSAISQSSSDAHAAHDADDSHENHEAHKTLWGLFDKPASWLRHSSADGTQAGLLDVLLIHRSTHTLLERQSRARAESLVQPIASMLETLLPTLKDEALLTRYAHQRFIRAENLTYGIHLGPLAFMVTVIAGDHPEPILRQCSKMLAKLHHDEMLTLADFDPSEPYPRLLPPGFVEDQ